ncbi:hypothetical protein MES5069_780008 [Mesorhizobium escarrei]|uniref:Uncharacterized protein n=1 Tax=Mesorhizobium escarrei TaxID=666018 RepID=A0ABN8KKF3_9HYPH|nr:hypothetical protein MES5069_780008 [Mesorhizobium escarrei]
MICITQQCFIDEYSSYFYEYLLTVLVPIHKQFSVRKTINPTTSAFVLYLIIH